MKIKLLNDLAKLPTRGSDYAAGWDLYAATDKEITIYPHETVKVGTGIAIEIPNPSWFGAIFARSGIATKQGLRPANCVGVIDADYRGELIVALHNDSDQTQMVEAGSRIAQLVILPFVDINNFEIVDELSDSERGERGFGSTGTK